MKAFLAGRYPAPPDGSAEVARKQIKFDDVRFNVRRFQQETIEAFHRADALQDWWEGMDVDLDSSARDVMPAAAILSPIGAIFSHECSADNFRG